MDYPIKTLSQLKPILQGFRKAAALTQAAVASRLGVTQQTYAQLEANPAAVSVERLFKVLRVLQVNLTLIPTADMPSESGVAGENAVPSPATALPEEKAAGSAKRKTPSSSRKQETSSATKARTTPPAKQAARKTTATQKARNATTASKLSRAAAKAGGGKKREDW